MSTAIISNLMKKEPTKIPIIKNGVVQPGWTYSIVHYTPTYDTNPNVEVTQGDGYIEFLLHTTAYWQSTGTIGLTTSIDGIIKDGDTLEVDFEADSNAIDTRFHYLGYFCQISGISGRYSVKAYGPEIYAPGPVSRTTHNVLLADKTPYFAIPYFYTPSNSYSGNDYEKVKIYNMYLVRADES